MNSNDAPTNVLHKSRLLTVMWGLGFVSCLMLAANKSVEGGLKIILVLGAGLFLIYFLFFEIQTIEIFPTYLSIKYICRKRLVEHREIDNVSLREIYRKGVQARYVVMRLTGGRNITVGNLRESADVVYEKLKACESTNEEFLER